MENPEIINTNEHCDSPVYVETSPVSSPVFVSKETGSGSESYISNEPLINPIIETNSSSSSTAPASPTSLTSPSAPAVPTSTPTHNTVAASSDSTSVEMVTVVIKDFTYCQEEFLKKIKENNVSISPETVMRLLRLAMIIVEQTNESGTKKKEFVINLLKEVVMNNKVMLTEHKLDALNLITGGIVSDSIDFLIDASKGKFDVNKVEKIAEEVAKSCFTICWEKLSKKK
jgi:hypothetical protein